jgi:molybdopterin-guanine dinucleotide biosynthesis protein
MAPRIIAICGTASNTGKTTLLCDLLRVLSRNEAWEAIKLTRGHYRSCGKDPHACCVSGLLGEQPTMRSGRQETYTVGKDTARYWDAGAANVHWVIATDRQVEAGVKEAVNRVRAPNVLIEGTSLLQVMPVDFAILVVSGNGAKAKASVRRALLDRKIHALYLSDENIDPANQAGVVEMLSHLSPGLDLAWLASLPVFRRQDLPQLINLVERRSVRAQATPASTPA